MDWTGVLDTHWERCRPLCEGWPIARGLPSTHPSPYEHPGDGSQQERQRENRPNVEQHADDHLSGPHVVHLDVAYNSVARWSHHRHVLDFGSAVLGPDIALDGVCHGEGKVNVSVDQPVHQLLSGACHLNKRHDAATFTDSVKQFVYFTSSVSSPTR